MKCDTESCKNPASYTISLPMFDGKKEYAIPNKDTVHIEKPTIKRTISEISVGIENRFSIPVRSNSDASISFVNKRGCAKKKRMCISCYMQNIDTKISKENLELL